MSTAKWQNLAGSKKFFMWHTINCSTENIVKMSQVFFEKAEKKTKKRIFWKKKCWIYGQYCGSMMGNHAIRMTGQARMKHNIK